MAHRALRKQPGVQNILGVTLGDSYFTTFGLKKGPCHRGAGRGHHTRSGQQTRGRGGGQVRERKGGTGIPGPISPLPNPPRTQVPRADRSSPQPRPGSREGAAPPSAAKAEPCPLCSSLLARSKLDLPVCHSLPVFPA